MPRPTYFPIATYTTTSTSEGTVTLNNISQEYKHLVITMQLGRFDNSLVNVYFRFNNDSSAAYNTITMAWANGGTGVYRRTLGTSFGPFYTNNETSVGRFDFMDYANTSKYKTGLSQSGTPAINAAINALTWRNTAGINRIDMFTGSGGFTVGSKITVWGVH